MERGVNSDDFLSKIAKRCLVRMLDKEFTSYMWGMIECLV